MRLGLKSLGDIFQRSGASLALAFGGVAAVAMTLQLSTHLDGISALVIVLVNTVNIFLILTLLLEFCRLRHQRRALGFVALWLFVLVVVPLILAGVFQSEETAQVCLLAPGFLALMDVSADKLPALHRVNLVHFAVVIILLINWRRQWKKLLSRAV